MRARLIQIGNSRGVRLSKSLLKKAGITDEVEIRAHPGALIMTAVRAPRAGWVEAAAKFGPSALIDPRTNTRFSEESWSW